MACACIRDAGEGENDAVGGETGVTRRGEDTVMERCPFAVSPYRFIALVAVSLSMPSRRYVLSCCQTIWRSGGEAWHIGQGAWVGYYV